MGGVGTYMYDGMCEKPTRMLYAEVPYMDHFRP